MSVFGLMLAMNAPSSDRNSKAYINSTILRSSVCRMRPSAVARFARKRDVSRLPASHRSFPFDLDRGLFFSHILKSSRRLGLMTADELDRTSDVEPVRGTRLPPGRSIPRGELRSLFEVCVAEANRPKMRARDVRDAAMLAILYVGGLSPMRSHLLPFRAAAGRRSEPADVSHPRHQWPAPRRVRPSRAAPATIVQDIRSTKVRSFAPLPCDVSREDLVPEDNFYRRLEARLDLPFVREFVAPLYAKGSAPSSLARFIHWLTAPSLTPRRRLSAPVSSPAPLARRLVNAYPRASRWPGLITSSP
jgi:hypothetical protein